jgi:hypothetical protein
MLLRKFLSLQSCLIGWVVVTYINDKLLLTSLLDIKIIVISLMVITDTENQLCTR